MRPAAPGLRQRRSPGMGEEQEEQGTGGQQEPQQQQAAPGLHTPHFTTSADLEASYGKPGSPTEAAEGASRNGERLGSKGGRVGRGAATAMPAAAERCCPGCLRRQQLPFLLLPGIIQQARRLCKQSEWREMRWISLPSSRQPQLRLLPPMPSRRRGRQRQRRQQLRQQEREWQQQQGRKTHWIQ